MEQSSDAAPFQGSMTRLVFQKWYNKKIIMQQDLNGTTIYILTEYNSNRTQSVLDVLNWRYALPAGNPAIFNIFKSPLNLASLT